MTTLELIDFARAAPSTQCKGCCVAGDDFGGYYTLTELIYLLADRLEMEMKICDSHWEEIGEWTKLSSQLENALNKACIYIEEITGSCPFDYNLIGCDEAECGNKRVTDCWKEWLLRGDAE